MECKSSGMAKRIKSEELHCPLTLLLWPKDKHIAQWNRVGNPCRPKKIRPTDF
jgi:hypothetical protein